MFIIEKIDELKQKREEKRASRFGVIHTSLFHYITPLMFFLASMIIGICYYNLSTLIVYFNTNIFLNGLIIFLALLALSRAFIHNFGLFRTARFIKEVENAAEMDDPPDAVIDKLHMGVSKRAYLIDTQNFHNAIENIRTFGHLNFTDNDARLIKHKLGYRIGLRRADVGFMAGILVMLGLLGTFLGLLKTIDAVGEAMGAMSSITTSDGSVDENAMTGFITGLSAPLQGMGLAFSSSLFGLSGSLLIGFFNHMCGGAQDKFIENVGRWVDDRIPKFKPSDDVMPKGERLATEDDLKSWLTGFVYLSVKTNKKIGSLTSNLIEHLKKTHYTGELLEKIESNQHELLAGIQSLNENAAASAVDAQSTMTRIASVLETQQADMASFKAISQEYYNQSTDTMLKTFPSVLEKVSSMSSKIDKNADIFQTSIQRITDANHSMVQSNIELKQNLGDLTSSIEQSLSLQTGIIKNIDENIKIGNDQILQQSDTFRMTADNLNSSLQKISLGLDSSNELQKEMNQTLAANSNSEGGSKAVSADLEKMMMEMNGLLNRIDNVNEDSLSDLIGVDFKKTNDNES